MIPVELDDQFEETKIARVSPSGDGWSIDRDDGWSLFVTNENEKTAPAIGETLRCYGRGIGYPVRGVVIGGRVYRYETPVEHDASQAAMRQKLTEEREASEQKFRDNFPSRPPLPTFKLKDLATWAKAIEVNKTDPYSWACVEYAAKWGALMDKRMEETDMPVRAIADETSREADTDGITGFMYGCAVNMLVHCWEHGEELRKWHNKEYGHEGPGVVNPAILTVGT